MLLDTSVVMSQLLNEETKALVEQKLIGHSWIAAETLPFEVGNALTSSLRQGRIDASDVAAAMSEFLAVLPNIQLIPVPLDAAMRIAARFKIYAYDAYVIAAAEVSGEQLLTLDVCQRECASELGIKVVKI